MAKHRKQDFQACLDQEILAAFVSTACSDRSLPQPIAVIDPFDLTVGSWVKEQWARAEAELAGAEPIVVLDQVGELTMEFARPSTSPEVKTALLAWSETHCVICECDLPPCTCGQLHERSCFEAFGSSALCREREAQRTGRQPTARKR